MLHAGACAVCHDDRARGIRRSEYTPETGVPSTSIVRVVSSVMS